MPDFTKQFSQNTDRLIDLLSAVNFSRSQLPPDILKKDPRTHMCELERIIQIELIRELKMHSPRRVHADFGPIDQRLMTLTTRLERYVRLGEEVSARMTCEALERGIKEIRCSPPLNGKISQDDFVSTHGDYLEKWLQLVRWSELYDQQNKSLLAQQTAHDQDVARLLQSIDGIRDRVREEPEFAVSFFRIVDHRTIADRTQWSPDQWEVHRLLVQHLLDRFTLELSKRSLEKLKTDLLNTRQKIDTLRVCLRNTPIVTEPGMMQDYERIMEDFVRESARSDVLMEENLRQLEKLSGALQQLDQSSSVLRQQQTAAELARKTLIEIQQLTEAEPSATEHKTIERSYIYGD